LIIPKQLRDAVGLVPGDVDVTIDGSGIRIEPARGTGFVERDGRFVIDADLRLTDEDVRALRQADRR
jgi:bifunctional DNA-binding transcriptional regulator/antitoxin component of YhaV-PrlF toxin-antitoxin module